MAQNNAAFDQGCLDETTGLLNKYHRDSIFQEQQPAGALEGRDDRGQEDDRNRFLQGDVLRRIESSSYLSVAVVVLPKSGAEKLHLIF